MNYIAELESEKAHSDGMAAAARYWMARAEQAEREKLHLAIALVKAAGGEIEIGCEVLHYLPKLTLVRTENPANDSIRYQVFNTEGTAK